MTHLNSGLAKLKVHTKIHLFICNEHLQVLVTQDKDRDVKRMKERIPNKIREAERQFEKLMCISKKQEPTKDCSSQN